MIVDIHTIQSFLPTNIELSKPELIEKFTAFRKSLNNNRSTTIELARSSQDIAGIAQVSRGVLEDLARDVISCRDGLSRFTKRRLDTHIKNIDRCIGDFEKLSGDMITISKNSVNKEHVDTEYFKTSNARSCLFK